MEQKNKRAFSYEENDEIAYGKLPEAPWTFCPGRTGATLVYQLIGGNGRSNQTHDLMYSENNFKKRGHKLIVNYRDIRDMIVSRWRTEVLSTEGRHEWYYSSKMNVHDVDIVREQKGFIHDLKHLSEIVFNWDTDTYIPLRYEVWNKDYNHIFDVAKKACEGYIGKHTGVLVGFDVPEGRRKELIDKYSRDNNYTVQAFFTNFTEWDEDRMIHGHHINKETTDWREKMDEDAKIYCNRKFGKLIKAMGYKL